MEERRYRLAPVRDARERAEAIRRGDLVDALDDARATETSLATARDRTQFARDALVAAIAAHATLVTTSPPAARLVAAERFVARRRHELIERQATELRAELAHGARLGDVETARGTLGRARAEREVIERHFARWRDTQRKLRERRDD